MPPDDQTSIGPNVLVAQLARLEQKLDGTGERLDGFAERMDRFEMQRDMDRQESKNLSAQLAGIAATCRLHVDRTNAAEATAAAAMHEAAAAKAAAHTIESSWNDIRQMARRPGSAEHQSTQRSLEAQERTRAEQRLEFEARITGAVAKALEAQEEIRHRREWERAEELREQESLEFKRQENIRQQEEAKRRKIQWIIGIGASVITTLSGTGLWSIYKQARDERQQVIRILDMQKQQGLEQLRQGHEQRRQGPPASTKTAIRPKVEPID